MIPLWRVTRNRYARRVYDTLDAVGITATSMLEFEADVAAPTPVRQEAIPEGVSIDAAPTTEDPVRSLDLDFSIPVTYLDDEWIVVARTDDGPVGRALVSRGQRPYVAPLHEAIRFDGAYVRRVYVDRRWRNEGIATRLVGESLAVAGAELGSDTAHALIAADNKPSRWVFEANGFRPVRRHEYARLFGLEHRRTTELQ
jgi:GNAT superfamily N-acetyltransferase